MYTQIQCTNYKIGLFKFNKQQICNKCTFMFYKRLHLNFLKNTKIHTKIQFFKFISSIKNVLDSLAWAKSEQRKYVVYFRYTHLNEHVFFYGFYIFLLPWKQKNTKNQDVFLVFNDSICELEIKVYTYII